jgi:predicted patatin/cPLA2 family phospholipase
MNINTLCIGGGGLKGFSFVSTLNILIEHNYIDLNIINKYTGTSFGSIFAFFLIIGYTPLELITYFNNLDKNELFIDLNLELFLSDYGFTDANIYMNLIETLFYLKTKLKDINFKDLEILTKKKIYILGTNYTTGNKEVFSVDTTPTMSTLLAIRISISIPLLMTPVKYNDNYYVDGCLTSNLGIEYCDSNNTLCICLQKPKYNNYNDLSNIINGLIMIGMLTIQKPPPEYKVLEIIQSDCINVVNGDNNYFKNMFDLGIKSALKFLKKEYINKINLIQIQIDLYKNNKNSIKLIDQNIKNIDKKLLNIDNEINKSCFNFNDNILDNIIIKEYLYEIIDRIK